jgi:hypothetical protein
VSTFLHNIYLIHQLTGICLIHRKYGRIEFNQDLVSGFLTALKDFSVEFSKGSGELKVIDMQIFYLMLVFKEGVLITAAADKNDDSKITHKALTDVIDKFINQYGDIIKTWAGDVRIFKDFDKIIDELLINGKIAEIKLKIPILKIYKKDYEKSQAKIAKNGLVISQEDLRKVSDKKPEWTNKRLPRQVITQGFLNEQQFDIAHIADGFHTIDDIAEEVGIPKSDVQTIIEKLDSLGLLQFIEIE